jgi:hypothetical protein
MEADISKMPSTSVATPNGRVFVPTADLACLPADPKTSFMTSEAPLMTLGCSTKSAGQFTNPTSLTTLLTRSRSPSQASLTWEMRLRPHSLALW